MEDLQNLKCHSAGSHDPSADQQHCADNLATKRDPYQLENSFSPFSTLRLVCPQAVFDRLTLTVQRFL